MENTTLTHAIAVEGSSKALAKALGKSPSTITKWKNEGPPGLWEKELKRLYGKRKPKVKK
jgi:transposase